jgi:hypothetical protein
MSELCRTIWASVWLAGGIAFIILAAAMHQPMLLIVGLAHGFYAIWSRPIFSDIKP